MARNGSGTYINPNTFVAGTTITASSHNQNWTDAASELTNSLALDGQSTMTGQLKAANGAVGAPALSFGSDLDSGFYRIGGNNIGVAVTGSKVLDIASTGLTVTGTVDATLVKQAGLQVVPLLISSTFSAASSLDIVLTAFTGYRGFRFILTDVTSSTGDDVSFRTSSDGGSTYAAGVADYCWAYSGTDSDTGPFNNDSSSNNATIFLTTLDNGATDVAVIELTIYATSTTKKKLVRFQEQHSFGDGLESSVRTGVGFVKIAADVDAVRFYPDTGTISGIFAVFGIP